MTLSAHRVTHGGRHNSNNALPPVTSFQAPEKLRKPIDSTRGGNLRIGKVITDARAAVNPGKPNELDRHASGLADPTPARRFVDGEERRVQEEIIEMLTTRLAKKEKETELLRRQQDAFEGQRSQLESRADKVEHELSKTKADLVANVERLERELQQAQQQADRCRTEAESQCVSLHEMRHQRERDTELFRSKERQLERQADELRRELAFSRAEKRALEDRLTAEKQHFETFSERLSESESRCQELESLVANTRAAVSELMQQLEASQAATLSQDSQCRKFEKEKQHQDDKVQQLSRNLRELNTRASDAERRKSDLMQAETQLIKQVTQLHRDNEELRARNGKLQAQLKQQQSRTASLEATKATSETKLKDVSEEVEHARKRLREHQFRIQQLQEEAKFLSKKKPTPPIMNGDATTISTPTAAAPIAGNDGEANRPNADNMPSWMRD